MIKQSSSEFQTAKGKNELNAASRQIPNRFFLCFSYKVLEHSIKICEEGPNLLDRKLKLIVDNELGNDVVDFCGILIKVITLKCLFHLVFLTLKCEDLLFLSFLYNFKLNMFGF